MWVHAQVASCIWLFEALWTKAPPQTGFLVEYWVDCTVPSSRDLLTGLKQRLLHLLALQTDSSLMSHQESPFSYDETGVICYLVREKSEVRILFLIYIISGACCQHDLSLLMLTLITWVRSVRQVSPLNQATALFFLSILSSFGIKLLHRVHS